MTHFLLALGCFILFTFSHAVACRLNLIRFETWKLLLLSFFWGIVYLVFMFKLNISSGLQLAWSSFVCYWLFCLFYLGELTTVQYDSPSMKILRALLRKPAKKITASEVKELFTDQELIIERLEDLMVNGHVLKENNRYKVQPRGKLIVRVFKWYRNLLERGWGG